MSLFGMIPWKAFTQAVPVLVDIIFKVRGNSEIEKEHKEISELKEKLKVLDAEIGAVYKCLRILIIGTLVVFLVSVSALIVAIMDMSK